MAVAEIALRIVLAVVFAVAFGSKLRSRAAYAEFADSLGDIGWLRGPVRAVVAAVVPAAEAAVVVLLALPWTVLTGLVTALVLLAVFTAVTGREAARGHRVRCRCFGAGPARIGPAQILRNVLLAAGAAAGLAIEPGSHGTAGAAGLVVAIGIALLAALALIRWDDLAYLVRTS
jgi:Methylamine utilisation protein MauE